jgi:hypothetical protein
MNNENEISNISMIRLSTNNNNNEKENNLKIDEISEKKLNLIKKLIKDLKEKNNKYINNELYKIFRDNVINVETKSTITTNNYSDNDYINNFNKSYKTLKTNKTYNIENNNNNKNNDNNDKQNNLNIKSPILNFNQIKKKIKILKNNNKMNKLFSINLTSLNNKNKIEFDLENEKDIYELDSFRFYKKYPCHKTNLYYYEPNKKYMIRNKTYDNIPLLDLNYVNKNQHQNFDKFNEMIFNIQNQIDNDINDIMFDTVIDLNNNNNKNKNNIHNYNKKTNL